MKAARFAAFFVICSVVVSLTSCGFFSTDRLTNIRTATDQTGKTPTSVYTPFQSFCVIADVNGVKPGSIIQAKWFVVSAQGVAPNTKVNTSDYIYAAGVGRVFFKLATWDGSMWPVGSYKVILLLNGLQVAEQTFSVQ